MTHISEIQIQPEAGGAKPPRWKPVKAEKKPTREQCRKEISRLNSKFGAPQQKSDEYRLSLVIDTLLQHSESEAHMRRVVDALEQLERFPDGYTIRQVAFDTRATELRQDPNCPKCDGSGFARPVMRDGYSYIPTGPDGMPIKCTCWRPVAKEGV